MRTTTATAAALAAAILSTLLAGCGGAEYAQRRAHAARSGIFAAENWEKRVSSSGTPCRCRRTIPTRRFMNARVAEKLNNLSDAARMYQSTIDIAPDHVQARAALGRMYVFGGSPARAHGDDQARPRKTSGRSGSADGACRRSGAAERSRGALADAEKAYELAPDNENAAAMLASLYQQKGETGRAIEVIGKTLGESAELARPAPGAGEPLLQPWARTSAREQD